MGQSKTLEPRRLKLDTKPKFERFERASTSDAKPKVEAKGGMFNAGILRDVVVLSRGEALGHDLWIDSVMLSDTMNWLNAQPKGIKSRFTHPGMSSDGLGKMLGRIHDARMRGDSVIADLSFTESSHDTPDGDLANYVTLLVTEDPEAAGLSIVFDRDRLAEQRFLMDNGATIEEDDDWGGSYIDTSEWKSPDPDNVEGYPHARLKELRAADVVDEPASNPDGMFSTTPVVRDADQFLAFALGLSNEKPADQIFGVSIDRASEFMTRFLSTRGLSIVSTTTTTADPVDQADDASNPPATPPVAKPDEPTTPPTIEVVNEQLSSRAAFNAELSKFTAKFGAENGTQWFTQGKTFEEALSLHCDALNAANEELGAKLKDTQERLSQVSVGVKEPFATAGLSAEGEKKNIGAMTNPATK